MGRGSSGAGHSGDEGWANRDTNYNGKIENLRSVTTMQDKQMYKATKEAISNFYAKTGAIERNIKMAELSNTVYGIGSKGMVILNGKFFDRKNSKEFMEKQMKSEYKSGWQTETNKPIAHVLTHELGHTTWSSHGESANMKAASKEIKSLAKDWRKDTKKQGYGKYSHSNIDEFWAEVVTKAVHGKADKYTRKAKDIIKKYKL